MKKVNLSRITLAQIVIFAVGTAVIVVGAFLKDAGWWGTVFLTFGITVLATTLLSSLQSLLGVDALTVLAEQLRLDQRVHEMGVTGIYPELGDKTIFRLFREARSLDLLFLTGKHTFHSYLDWIKHAVGEHGCKVRILVCDPRNIILSDETLSESLCPGTNISVQIEEVTKQLRHLIQELREHHPPPQKGGIELKYFKSHPTCSILIVNDEIIRFTSFLPYSVSSRAPSFDVEKGKPLFDGYKETFKRVWEKANPVEPEVKIDFPLPRQLQH